MRATLLYAAGDVRVEEVPDSAVKLPTDALVRVTASAICGSDLWPYASLKPADGPARMGHEFIGVVEETGSEVTTVRRGDLVVSPFAISDGTCEFCREGLQTSCVHPQAGFWDQQPAEGAQAGAIRVPLADGTLVRLPGGPDPALIPSLLTLVPCVPPDGQPGRRGGRGNRATLSIWRRSPTSRAMSARSAPVMPGYPSAVSRKSAFRNPWPGIRSVLPALGHGAASGSSGGSTGADARQRSANDFSSQVTPSPATDT